MQNNTQNCEVRKGHLGDETSPILPTSPILVPFALVSQDAKGEGVDSRPGRNPVSVSMPRRGIQEDENSPGRYRDTHACRGYFQSSSSLLLPLHQVGKLDSWEDFQDRQAMTLLTTRSTAGTTEPMSSAPTANGICSFRALRLLLDVQPFSSASQAGPRAVAQPHPPVPDRRSHLAAPPETGNQRPRLAGPLPIPGHPGRRPPARRSEVHRGQPGAGRDGGRPVRVYLVEPPLPWRRACRSHPGLVPGMGAARSH